MLNTPLNLDDSTIDQLNDLIRYNIDSSRGFKEAANVIDDPDIRARFWGFAHDRERDAEELKQYVAFNEEEPEDSGSAAGAVHRWWLKVRGKASGGDPSVVLSEAERGEDAIKHEYEDVLKKTAGSPVNDVLQRQYATVKSEHDAVRAMRDSCKANGS